MLLTPSLDFRYSFRRGYKGWDVMALQIGLNSYYGRPKLEEDGDFGPKTEQRVKEIQEFLNITVDGICGGQTQHSIIFAVSKSVEGGLTPRGLIQGVSEGESGCYFAAVSKPNLTTLDVGPWQNNTPNESSQARYHVCFEVVQEAIAVATEIKTSHNAFLKVNKNLTQEKAWWLAILNYNWPAAAYAIATGNDSWLSNSYPWIERATGGRLHTGWEWCDRYVESKIMYVKSWTV